MRRLTKEEIYKLCKTKIGFVFYKSVFINSYQIPLLEELVKEKKIFIFYEDKSSIVFKGLK